MENGFQFSAKVVTRICFKWERNALTGGILSKNWASHKHNYYLCAKFLEVWHVQCLKVNICKYVCNFRGMHMQVVKTSKGGSPPTTCMPDCTGPLLIVCHTVP